MQDSSLDFLPASHRIIQHKLSQFKYPNQPRTFEEAVWLAFDRALSADVDDIRSRVAYFNSQLSMYRHWTSPQIHQQTKQIFLKFFLKHKIDYSFEIPEKEFEKLFREVEVLLPQEKVTNKLQYARKQSTSKTKSVSVISQLKWTLLLLGSRFLPIVSGANQSPTISSTITSYADQNSPVYFLDMLQFASDPDGDPLSVSNIVLLSGDARGIDTPGSAQYNETSQFKVTPTDYKFLCVNESAVSIYRYRINDNNGGYVFQNATITIDGLNDPPVVSGTISSTTTENSAPYGLSLRARASDIDSSDILSVGNFTTLRDGVSINETDVLGVSRVNNTLSIDPAFYNYLNSSTSITFTYYYYVFDNHGAFANETLTLRISGANDAPYSISGNLDDSYPPSNGAAITQSSPSFSIDLLADGADPDLGNVLGVSNVVLLGGDSRGVSVSGSNMTVNPSLYKFLGLNSFQQPETITIRYKYNINDGSASSFQRNINITITGENDCPTASSSINSKILKTNPSPINYNLLTYSSDIDTNDVLTVQNLNVTGNTIGITQNGAALSLNTTHYNYLNSTQAEFIVYEYDISDGHGGVIHQTASITIRGSSSSPTLPPSPLPQYTCNSTTITPTPPQSTTSAPTSTPTPAATTTIPTTSSTTQVATTGVSSTTALTSSTPFVGTTSSETTTEPLQKENASNDSSENNNIPLYAGLGAGAGLTACAIAVGLGLWARRRKSQLHSSPVESEENGSTPNGFNLNSLELRTSSFRPTSGTATPRSLRSSIYIARPVIGDKYEIIGGTKLTQQESDELFDKTGRKIPVGNVEPLGKGQYGEILLARNRDTGEYVAMKVVKGRDNVKKSKEEDLIHAELSNKNLPHIMKFYDSVEIEDEGDVTLYQFMPLGIDDGKKLSQQLAFMEDNSEQKNAIMIDIVKACLIALIGAHNEGKVHLDFKNGNLIILKKGPHVGDFGCSKKSANGLVYEADGDTRYFSPERLTYCREKRKNPNNPEINFNGRTSDAWALGITLIEMFTGKYPFDRCDFHDKEKLWDENYFLNKFAEIPELKNPEANSIWFVIKGLLKIDPAQRLTPEKALNHPVFKNHKSLAENTYRDIFLLKPIEKPQSMVVEEDEGAYLNMTKPYEKTANHVLDGRQFYYYKNRGQYNNIDNSEGNITSAYQSAYQNVS